MYCVNYVLSMLRYVLLSSRLWNNLTQKSFNSTLSLFQRIFEYLIVFITQNLWEYRVGQIKKVLDSFIRNWNRCQKMTTYENMHFKICIEINMTTSSSFYTFQKMVYPVCSRILLCQKVPWNFSYRTNCVPKYK